MAVSVSWSTIDFQNLVSKSMMVLAEVFMPCSNVRHGYLA